VVKRGLIALVLCAACLALAAPAGAAPTPEPYASNDAGGFRNVLPAGENGTDNATQLAEFELNGTYPPHFADQLPLYANLLYASPALTHEQIASYFKDATFGVKQGELAFVESPRSDVTIQRDSAFGVPHIYGSTRGGVMFGAGYAGAEDRLFLMDVLRHTARAQLSAFAGGAEGNRAMDRTVWLDAPYTESDLEFQIDHAGALYGAPGERVLADGREFVAGINAFITAAKLNPNLMPAEYAALGKTPEEWKLTDVIAEASLIGGIFGTGGGGEVKLALMLQALEKQFGKRSGRRAWSDFREANDPEAPTTVARAFKYDSASAFAANGLALPDPGSVTFVPDGEMLSTPATQGAQTSPRGSARSGSARGGVGAPVAGGRLTATLANEPAPRDASIGARLLHQAGHDSNWELVSREHSSDGHSLAVMGPQVGYYTPEILLEEDLHGPGIDARGAAFPGVNEYVQLGHGRDYAWSATSGEATDTHTFAEVLCQDEVHYLYKGQCLPMEKLEHTNKWTPNASDMTPPGAERLFVYRTVHGIVYARGRVGGKPVAFVHDRTTYFHEADSAIGLSELNEPGFVTGPKRFMEAASKIDFGFNWAYVDANNVAYYLSGWYPMLAHGTSPDFPLLGTGEYDYQGFEPKLHLEQLLPFKRHPKAINPEFLVSWNNKPAPRFAAATNKDAWGSIYRMQLIRNFIEKDIAGGRKMGEEELISAMDEAATQDIRMVELWPILKEVLGTPSDPKLQDAIAELESWYEAGAHRRDLTNRSVSSPGSYEHNAAVTIMDAWWPKLLEAVFKPALGGEAFAAVQSVLRFGAPYPGAEPEAPEFQDGWYGYVSKDLHDLLAATAGGPRPSAPYSRIYCGEGSFAACQSALDSSLLEALSVAPAQIYGHGACAENAQASCFDMNRWTSASAISLPPFPFQNRPTFQQAVELTRTLPRQGAGARAPAVRPRRARSVRSGAGGGRAGRRDYSSRPRSARARSRSE
jgi:acyl-homoserine lactone acylase PvdQ